MRTETIEQTITTWTAEPGLARSTPTVTAHAADGQAVIQAGPFTWRADLPIPVGGTNQAPSPTALLLGALAGCAVVFVQDTIAPQLKTAVKAIEATVRCESDARGLLGMDGVAPDLQNVSLAIRIDTPDGAAAVAEIARIWQERCPIYLALLEPMDIAVRFDPA